MEKYYFKMKKYVYIFIVIKDFIFTIFWIIFDIIFVIKINFLSIFGAIVPIIFTIAIINKIYIREGIIKYIKIIYDDKGKIDNLKIRILLKEFDFKKNVTKIVYRGKIEKIKLFQRGNPRKSNGDILLFKTNTIFQIRFERTYITNGDFDNFVLLVKELSNKFDKSFKVKGDWNIDEEYYISEVN